MPLAPGQLNRRRAPSNRINPVLSFTGETNLNRYSAVTGGTRPPVVGRERTLDPDRTKRYDSNEDHLSKYLKALEQKTAAGQRRASILIDDEISDMSLSSDDALKNVTLGKGSQFLKSNALRTSRHDNGNATTARPTAVSFQTVRTSNALQKAQAFSSKYNLSKKVSKDAVKGVDSSETVPEKVHASELYSKVESSDKSESSFSDQGFLNVKDLIDLPSLSDGTSQHGSARLPSQTNSLNASGKSESSVTTSQHLPSMSDGLVVDHKSDSDITEYEEDFEEDSVHSQASSHSTLGSKSGQDVESAESKSVSSNEPDVESSSHVNSEGATHVRRSALKG